MRRKPQEQTRHVNFDKIIKCYFLEQGQKMQNKQESTPPHLSCFFNVQKQKKASF